MASRIVVHYEHVGRALTERFGISPDRISVHAFPWKDFERVEFGEALFASDPPRAAEYYLFFGVLRADKGVDVLAGAWDAASRELALRYPLVVAGRVAAQYEGVARKLRASGAFVIDRYIGDVELVGLIKRARAIVLPYTAQEYAHSSVVLLAMAAGKCLLTADIPLFRATLDAGDSVWFEAEDAGSLAKALLAVDRFSASEVADIGAKARRKFLEMQAAMGRALCRVYAGGAWRGPVRGSFQANT